MALAGLATRTESIELGTSVTLLPQANPVRLAGEVNLLDQISEGRFNLGVGVGWRESEMENLGYDFEERGARMTDHLKAMNALWEDDVATYDGEFVSFEEFELTPEPVKIRTRRSGSVAGSNRRSSERPISVIRGSRCGWTRLRKSRTNVREVRRERSRGGR